VELAALCIHEHGTADNGTAITECVLAFIVMTVFAEVTFLAICGQAYNRGRIDYAGILFTFGVDEIVAACDNSHGTKMAFTAIIVAVVAKAVAGFFFSLNFHIFCPPI
jgi:hypothetical protein